LVGQVERQSKVCSRPVAPAMRSASVTLIVAGEPQQERYHRRHEAADDQHHLFDVGPGHGLHAAEHGVEHHGDAR
jgi:hypothetical protein